MATSNERWINNLQFSVLFCPPPQDAEQRNAQVTSYVEFLSQFISEQFPDDLDELIRSRYPSNVNTLFDDVLATFVLHHPEYSLAVILPIISCIIDGLLEYDRSNPPFASFISLICPKSELVLACGEILRILTHYNRPIYKRERQADRSGYVAHASSSKSTATGSSSYSSQLEKKFLRPLSPWITDMLLEASLVIRRDYFRWCGGVAGTYAATELKPPSTGKHLVHMTSTPTWAVANGAAVILSVCDEEVARYETATLTAAAVQAVLLPLETTPKDEHPVAGLPALESYARLFHRYYVNSSPSVTQRLLLRLLEAPPSWAPYALEAAVQLVELLREADNYASGVKLPRNWMCLYFLRAIGTAMSMQGGTVADAAAALLFRILSQPALLFPPPSQGDGVEVQPNHLESSTLAEATAQEIASMLCAHGLEVERRICMIWEAAYGLIPLNSPSSDLPEVLVATSLQPPRLSWTLYLPLLKVLEYLPRGSPSESCLVKIFVATVEAILRRIFPPESWSEHTRSVLGSASKNLAVAELRTIFHSLFLGSCASVELASRLLFVVMTVCVSHEAELDGSKQSEGEGSCSEEGHVLGGVKGRFTKLGNKKGPIAAFESYVIAVVCALSFELHTYSLISKQSNRLDAGPKCRSIDHTRRILAVLEALVSSELSFIGTSRSYSSNEIVAIVMVAAHVCDLFRRSKACMKALSLLMRRKWDKEVRSRAYSLFSLISIHCKTVASIVDRARPLEARLLHAPSSSLHGKKRKIHMSIWEKAESNLLTMDGRILRSVLAEKQELCFLVVSLLWHALIISPEIQPGAESSSAQQGWRKVVDVLANVVSASPAKAATAVVLQASNELKKPWIVEDDDHRKKGRRINQRVVKVIVELMNNHENSESLMIMASSSDLLLQATDWILVDEEAEACTLPQLELLEATARAVQAVFGWGESGLAVAEGILDVLKCRLAATACCVSHPSARVRALSMSVLREVVHVGSSCARAEGDIGCDCSDLSITCLRDAVKKCLKSEAHSRVAVGLPVHYVEAAAKELGCFTISS